MGGLTQTLQSTYVVESQTKQLNDYSQRECLNNYEDFLQRPDPQWSRTFGKRYPVLPPSRSCGRALQPKKGPRKAEKELLERRMIYVSTSIISPHRHVVQSRQPKSGPIQELWIVEASPSQTDIVEYFLEL